MSLMLDWRGTPITHHAHVLFPRKWGRSAHSTEMVEGVVHGFHPTGRITVDVLRSSRPRETGGTGRTRYAVPAHSVTVVPAPAGLPAGNPGDAAPSPTPQAPSPAAPLELLTVDGTQYGPYPGQPTTATRCPYDTYLFTRGTAQRIVEDLHRDNCGLTAAFEYDGTLRFTWDATYRDESGTERVTPDAHGRYAIGGLWPWDFWPETGGATPQP
ncbi:hypothetical protein [Streptomyces sp. A1136]|uniref:hypothetical protein n=1 Tax=Streptomyces sp. A1136 TaxID=2563102 RepID=UPI00109E8D99|nr:hypothetical protein [Streptomyces sp. A1136]THA53130.1 hypothetical protein E6R62_18695 [Streptomyces sp. A1136]